MSGNIADVEKAYALLGKYIAAAKTPAEESDDDTPKKPTLAKKPLPKKPVESDGEASDEEAVPAPKAKAAVKKPVAKEESDGEADDAPPKKAAAKKPAGKKPAVESDDDEAEEVKKPAKGKKAEVEESDDDGEAAPPKKAAAKKGKSGHTCEYVTNKGRDNEAVCGKPASHQVEDSYYCGNPKDDGTGTQHLGVMMRRQPAAAATKPKKATVLDKVVKESQINLTQIGAHHVETTHRIIFDKKKQATGWLDKDKKTVHPLTDEMCRYVEAHGLHISPHAEIAKKGNSKPVAAPSKKVVPAVEEDDDAEDDGGAADADEPALDDDEPADDDEAADDDDAEADEDEDGDDDDE